MRRLRRGRAPAPYVGRLTDENGEPITFATPGEPTVEERRRYALTVQRATTSPPLTREQQAEVAARAERERALQMQLAHQRAVDERRSLIS